MTDSWDDGFNAGYQAALDLAIATCNERAVKHQKRGTRLTKDYQAEAAACAFAIAQKSRQTSTQHRTAHAKRGRSAGGVS